MKTAAEAKQYLDSMNARTREDVPDWVDNIPPVYVFSLYWHPFTVNLGHMGGHVIPALDRDDPAQVRRGYSNPLVMPGTFPEEYDKLSGTQGLRFWDAFASKKNPNKMPGYINDLLGIGSSQGGLHAFTTDRTWFGVFVACGLGATKEERARFEREGEWNFPTQYELKLAKEKLTKMMTQLYKDAKNKALRGPDGIKEIQPPEREACEWLGFKEEWCRPPVPQDECPECHQPINPGLPVHFIQQGGCGAVLDEDKVKRNRTPGYEHIWGPKVPVAGAPPRSGSSAT